MSEHDPLPLELGEIEAKLGSLSPGPARLRRDALMYEAGRSSAGHLASSGRVDAGSEERWKRAAFGLAGCLVIAMTLAIHAYTRTPQVRREVVYVERESAEPQRQVAAIRQTQPAQADDGTPGIARSERVPELPVRMREPQLDRWDYLYQRDLALRHGVEAVPLPRPAGGGSPSPSVSVRELMDDLLPPVVDRDGAAI
jgi:hypothetical protein